MWYVLCMCRRKRHHDLTQHWNLNRIWRRKERYNIDFLSKKTTCRRKRPPPYLRYFSFVSISYKVSLVKTLFSRALRICCPCLLRDEMVFLRRTLLANGYPGHFIDKHSVERNVSEPSMGPEKKNLYVRIPFLGDPQSATIKRQLANAFRSFNAAKVNMLFTTVRLPNR